MASAVAIRPAPKRRRARKAKPDQVSLERVAALVPAHNEEATIEKTIESLMAQIHPFEFVLIIADNCTDGTVSIVEKLQERYGSDKLRLLQTEGNTHKKAGALNQGFAKVPRGIDFLFSMDADTILHPKIIEEGVRELKKDPQAGGICSAYRTLPPEVKGIKTRWEKFLWRLQNIEFGHANAWRIENLGSARVLPGVSVLYRMDALLDVLIAHKDGTVWATDSLVEDYRLTLELKDLGWKAKSSQDMISWSDVPTSLTGKGGLWNQRVRWYSGTVDEIRKRGLQKHSRYELISIILLRWSLLSRILLIGAYSAVLIFYHSIEVFGPFLLLPVFSAGIQLYRLKYADQLDKWQILMTGTLLVNEAYAVLREIIYARSIWLSYTRPNRGW